MITKFLKKLIFWIFSLFLIILNVSFALEVIDQTHLDTLNQDQYQAIWSEDITQNPLRQWSHLPVDDSRINKWIISAEDPITNYDSWAFKTLKFIKNLLNYFLGFLGFITLIYLLYHWFLVVTSSDENKHSEALKALKNWAIAIWWIWLSWIIVSAIFYLVNIIVS